MEELLKLTQDCLEYSDLLTDCLFAGVEITDEEAFTIMSRLHDRFRKIAPDWPGILPLESPDVTEETEPRIRRLSSEPVEPV